MPHGYRIGGDQHVGGYVIVTDPEFGVVQEYETLSCVHCNMHFQRKLGSGFDMCKVSCYGPVCQKEFCLTRCIPFEAKLEAREGTRSQWKGKSLSPWWGERR